jgi:Xaa-Pro aminopeptidase
MLVMPGLEVSEVLANGGVMFAARFQSFEVERLPQALPDRLAALRAELARRRLDGFVVPRADRQQNEYVPACEERLAWLTGFTGSAGLAIVLPQRAALFVDGRYTLQARQEVNPGCWSIEHLSQTTPESWLPAQLSGGFRLGYDPWLHTIEGAEKLAAAASAAGASLDPTQPNPIDVIWHDRPAPPLGPVVLHDVRFAGSAVGEKLGRIREELAKLNVDTLVLSDAHAVAWTFNIRGADIAYTPLPLAFAMVPQTGRPKLFIDERKLSNAVRNHLETVADVRDASMMITELTELARSGRSVRLDAASAASALAKIVTASGGSVSQGPDPVALMKAIKNPVEIAGARAAHLRDGAALAQFLCWFDAEAPRGELTEIDAVAALETFRRRTGLLKDIAFPTIAGAGPNGAIVHYRVTRNTNRRISPGDLFLIDSGGQYEDGTTDITRTIAVGQPTAEMRERFTRVLKGHIALARTIFPDGTTGAQLDSFARQYLWAAGLDFDHGTGHGVGSFLSVHEGPARISKLGTVALARGMILSNEPGYYKPGAYGIRIENLVLVIAAEPRAGAEKPLNAFETLTLAPIDRRLIEVRMMTPPELAFVDEYHARVAKMLRPLVDEKTWRWLEAVAAPLVAA